MTDELVQVRASIHLPGLRPGEVVWVNPNDPYVAERMELGYLQRTATEGVEAADETEEPVGDGVDGTAEPPTPTVDVDG